MNNNYVTAQYYYDIANAYRSILVWQGHHQAMAKSHHHAGVMMGKIDEPYEGPEYNPINSAGFFGLSCAMDVLSKTMRGQTPNSIINSAIPVAIQLLFGLLNDKSDMAGIARWMRTGYIGTPNQSDYDHVPALNKFIRKISRFSGNFEENVIAGKWETPLERTVYNYPGPAQQQKLKIEKIVHHEEEY